MPFPYYFPITFSAEEYTDLQASLITALYNWLRQDDTLLGLMGTFALYLVWAKTDAALPYLVHRLDLRTGDIWPERKGTYTLDIWSYSPSATEITAIRKRLIELLDRLQFYTDEVKNVKLNLSSDGFVPSNEPEIWHYSLLFDISLWRQSEAIQIASY